MILLRFFMFFKDFLCFFLDVFKIFKDFLCFFMTFYDLFYDFVESKKGSALFVCMDTEGIKWKDVKRPKYQKFLQKAIKDDTDKNRVFKSRM